ncbi:hypothetical protein DL96DRAFT_1822169 [Flagelloscypha sp. PMI_526]|nr:hypothetical protein DL96DRAFT_1822169 [Flagelloscypha sp. PMI_526]
MGLPLELVREIFLSCDKATLSYACLSGRTYYLEAKTALYRQLRFNSSQAADRFLYCQGHRHLNFTKYLNIYIPSRYTPENVETWGRLFLEVRERANLISLTIMSIPDFGMPSKRSSFHNLVDLVLFIPSLKHIAVSTEIVPSSIAVQLPALRELHIVESSNRMENPLGSFIETRDLITLAEDRKPKLETLCYNWHIISIPLLKSLFDLRGLRRLSIHRAVERGSPEARGTLHLLEETCPTLQELAIWMVGSPDDGYMTELGTFTFPNLETFILYHTSTYAIKES